MTTRYGDVFACFECVGEHKEEPSKIISRSTFDDDAIISLSFVELGAAPKIVSMSMPIDQ